MSDSKTHISDSKTHNSDSQALIVIQKMILAERGSGGGGVQKAPEQADVSYDLPLMVGEKGHGGTSFFIRVQNQN